MSTICAAKIVSFENSPIRSGCLWSKTRNKRRTSVAAIARSWRLLRNPKSRAIRLLSLSCIIAILLLSENNNIYSNIILLWSQFFSKSFPGAEVQKAIVPKCGNSKVKGLRTLGQRALFSIIISSICYEMSAVSLQGLPLCSRRTFLRRPSLVPGQVFRTCRAS